MVDSSEAHRPFFPGTHRDPLDATGAWRRVTTGRGARPGNGTSGADQISDASRERPQQVPGGHGRSQRQVAGWTLNQDVMRAVLIGRTWVGAAIHNRSLSTTTYCVEIGKINFFLSPNKKKKYKEVLNLLFWKLFQLICTILH